MGTVYLADDLRLPGRQYALKEMSPRQVSARERDWAVNAFQQEAHMLARLEHLGLTDVTDFFGERGNWYLVMEFVQGQTLDQVIESSPRQRLKISQTLDIFDQLCEVLEYLHGQTPPVIFRDLKPDNVMLTPAGRIKLIDFGIARFFKPGQGRDTVNLGTPGYAAPEQYGSRGQTDARADVYGLGVLLHQMLTGYDPTITPFRLPPIDALNPAVPDDVSQAIQKAIQHDAELRFSSVRSFHRAVMDKMTVLTPSARPNFSVPSWLIGIWGVGGVLVLLTVLIFRVVDDPDSMDSTQALPQPTRPTRTEPVPPTVIVSPSPMSSPTNTAMPTATETPASTPVNWVYIPDGRFVRGSTRADIDTVLDQLCPAYTGSWCRESSFQDERVESEIDDPDTNVYYLDSQSVDLAGFYIDRYEVTNAQYERCVVAGVCEPPDEKGSNPRRTYFADTRYADYPVVYVTWNDARDYCQWVEGRLPIADEWEKAARGTDGPWWPWGGEADQIPNRDAANFRHPGAAAADEKDMTLVGGDLAAVGSYATDSSPYGVMDMAGNVMEWVDAWYGPGRREIRGGSWNTGSFALRSASRTGRVPSACYFDVGFRCAYDVKP
jgi:serine/threonine protein kinase